MKILQVNKFFFTKGQGGGAARYFFDLTKLLSDYGHQVIPFSMKHPNNLTTPYEKYFVSHLDLSGPRLSWQSIKALPRIFWSREAARKLELLIRKEKPDLVHLHNIYHHLSSSILPVLKKYHLPVVMTVHDFKLICPNYSLFDGREACQSCYSREACTRHRSRGGNPNNRKFNAVDSRLRGNDRKDGGNDRKEGFIRQHYRHCFLKKCVKDSYLASLVATAEAYFQKWGKFYQKYIDLFLCPSQFVADRLIRAGFSADKIRLLPHFVMPDCHCEEHRAQQDATKQSPPEDNPQIEIVSSPAQIFTSQKLRQAPRNDNDDGSYYLYFGRLEKIKGADLLIEAAKRLPEIKLKIAGTGLQETQLKEQAKNLKNIKFLGWLDKEELATVINQAQFVVVPSKGYETFGLSVLEAFIQAKPVIAANHGALPELVKDQQTGFLFKPGNVNDLAVKIRHLWHQPELAQTMGQRAQKLVQQQYNCEKHYQRLIEYYKKVKS